MAEQAQKVMTVDEFLTWDDGTDTRYELADGIIRAMAPPGGRHGTIVANVLALVHTALRTRRPCRPQAEAGIKISERTWWQADAAVTCQPSAAEVVEPLLIVEVLSPTTRWHDLGRKLNDYKGLASLQEIWLIDSERRWTQVWQREAEGWIGRDFVGAAHFQSDVLATTVSLDVLYESSGV